MASPLRGRSGVTHKIEAIAKQYEESYRRPGTQIDATGVPSVEQFKNAVEDICINNGLRRIVLLFDEAAHVFRPEQQRSFFTLFRDLRSPYILIAMQLYTQERHRTATRLAVSRCHCD